ncbi:nucleoside hydrolase [Macrolepiota fuliginosa MF-IS2]|uniref:Nucleoside hydrolase n=1 Tax=Macrolepiota fuliginosa MF-IS2 TaxID=1400762 RepID=A0A9P5XBP7_9AGAR|nr:nucleoside hydrolase [Macrolepiota fuliginosa MF-IS2]
MRNVWLDVDPGHDDAIALLLAVHCQEISIIGVSTTHGNAPSTHTALNAARCLHAYGASPHIKVFPGATKPLILPAKHDPEIHGEDGLGGVEGLPDAAHPAVLDRFVKEEYGEGVVRALEGMAQAIRKLWKGGRGEKMTIVSTGPMTNIALFVSVYPDLMEQGAVEEFVFMGGGVGLGNRSAVAEYNVLTDPHATQVVLDAPVKTTMIPINVTHTAIATYEIQHRLLSGTHSPLSPNPPLPNPRTPLRHTLNTVITFFASTYKSVFGFHDGPPLHDALTIAYLQNPGLFKGRRYRVDVELSTGSHCTGETVVDIWDYKRCGEEMWGRDGKNCFVVQELDVPGFFDLFLECVDKCDRVSPLNT